MTVKSEETFTQKEIQERFERLFNRPMTAKERACFFLPPEQENEKASGGASAARKSAN
jgi:hypothetical protein